MSYPTLQTEYAQGIALIWMNRPKMRNALDNLVIAELTDAFSAAIEDDGVRAMVIGRAAVAGAGLRLGIAAPVRLRGRVWGAVAAAFRDPGDAP